MTEFSNAEKLMWTALQQIQATQNVQIDLLAFLLKRVADLRREVAVLRTSAPPDHQKMDHPDLVRFRRMLEAERSYYERGVRAERDEFLAQPPPWQESP